MPKALKGQSGAHGRSELPRTPEDPIKAQSAEIFKALWAQAEAHPKYAAMKLEHKKLFG